MKLRDFGLLTDENVHPEVVMFLRENGFHVKTTAEVRLLGAADPAVMRAAASEQRVISNA